MHPSFIKILKISGLEDLTIFFGWKQTLIPQIKLLHPWTKSTKFGIAVHCLHYKYFKEGKLLVLRPFFWPCTQNTKTIRSRQVHSFESYIVLVFWRYHHFNNMNLLLTLPFQFKGIGCVHLVNVDYKLAYNLNM